jgi:hypothetical protein
MYDCIYLEGFYKSEAAIGKNMLKKSYELHKRTHIPYIKSMCFGTIKCL